MKKYKNKMQIGKMVGMTFVVFFVFAIIGGILCAWFGGEARPAVRTIVDAEEYAVRYACFYFGGLTVNLVFSLIMELLAGKLKAYKLINWLINMAILVFAALALAVCFYIFVPTKDANINIISAVSIFLQGIVVYFVGSLFAPAHFGIYNPFAGIIK